MALGKSNNDHATGSTLGGMTLLAAAVAVAYLLPDGEKEAAASKTPATAFAPRRASGGKPSGESETGRGRRAESPTDIPARGWKDILYRVYGNISDHRVFAMAAV